MMHRITLTFCAAMFFAASGYAASPITNATSIRIDGAGPLKVGMTIAQAEKAVGARLSIHNNEDPQGECVFADVPGAPKEFMFMLIKGTIARFDIFEGAMKTAEGAGIGSTEDDVKRLYARAQIKVTPHAYVDGRYLEVTMPGVAGLKYVFETDGKKVTAFRAGREPEIFWIEGCA